MEQLKFQEASEHFQQAVELHAPFVPGYVNLGIAYFNLQEYDRALEAFDRALQLAPQQVHAHYMRGLIYRNQDRVEESISEFLKVNEQDPNDPSTNYFLGLLYSRQKQYEKAVETLKKVISREPYNASAHYNLAIAFLRSGRQDEGRAEMNEFRRLQGLFGATTIGLQYLEQGKYSIAIDRIPDEYLPGAGPEPDTPRIRVTFSEAAAAAGLRFEHGGPGLAGALAGSRQELEEKIVPFAGSGVALADYDQDGHVDLFFANAGTKGERSGLFHNRGDGTFRDVTAAAGITYSGKTMAATWGDFNGDGHPDLYLVNYGPNVLYENKGDGTFADITARAGLGDPGWGMVGIAVDYDHDGDLDLFVGNFSDLSAIARADIRFPDDLTGASNVLYQNNGDGTFTDVSESSGLAGGPYKTVAAVCTDFDNSRDIDFYVVNLDGPNQLFSNLRDGTFRDVAAEAGSRGSGRGSGVGIGDLNQDGMPDFALPSLNGGRILTNTGRAFESRPLSLPDQASNIHSSYLFDFDNDGDLDLLLAAAPLFQSSAPAGREFRNFYLLENRKGTFVDVSEETGLNRYKGLAVRGVGIADYDGDGDLDLVANVNGSAPLLLRNDGGNQNNWLRIRLKGTNSNRLGFGTKVEIKSGRLFQKSEVYGGSGFLSQSPAELHFGLGKRTRVDMVRMLWPGGVLQSELNPPINRVVEFSELDRKGTSCPLLYTWDGTTYRFQTDFLGGSAYGYLLGPGTYNYPDTDEYVKLNRDQVALKDGHVAITLNNQLEEVIMFDQLELLVVDHPAEYEVYPDEKLLPGPPYDDFRLFTVSHARPPLTARDEKGRNILPEIRKIDRTYPDLFRKLPFKGYAQPHEMILDLGPVPPERVVLLMHAWIDYADSTSNLAASQAGHRLIPPYLQVEDEQGNWVTVLERMGFPAGLPKTMTVDLSGKFLSDSRKVRIVTSMRIYWDQILVETASARGDFRIQRLSPTKTDLHFRGFPAFVSPDGREPKVYDYDRISVTAPWKVHVGGYTRYGDVLPLLLERDDRFVITRSGDEIETFFDLSEAAELPEGWVRDYLVFVSGFGKDMDINSAAPDYVGPLPFHGMSAYPYPEDERYLRNDEYLRYLREWNTRIEREWVPNLRGD